MDMILKIYRSSLRGGFGERARQSILPACKAGLPRFAFWHRPAMTRRAGLLLIILCLFVTQNSYSGKDNSEAEIFEEFFTADEEVSDTNSEYKAVKIIRQTDDEIINYNKAKIIALNKITAKSKEIILDLKEPVYFGNIEITLHQCKQKTDPYSPDNVVLLEVVEHKHDEDPILLFQGWMFSSSVGLSTFEHPIYEIFAKDCF
jgi:hypothetical protein